MPGRILILDSVAINRVVLRVKLAAACYETFQAETLAEALRVAKAARPDILLFSAAAPGVDPARLVSRFKTLMPGHIIAIMMIEAGSAPASPEAALAAGIDEVLPRTCEDAFLTARLRAVFRALEERRELQAHEYETRLLGFAEAAAAAPGRRRVALVGSHVTGEPDRLSDAISGLADANIERRTAREALGASGKGADGYVISDAGLDGDGCRGLIADLRSQTQGREAAIIVLTDGPSAQERAAAALDMGADDVLLPDASRAEIAIRVGRQLDRRASLRRQRLGLEAGMRAALTDPLTGLWNRRYALPRLGAWRASVAKNSRPLAVMIADIDRFKAVNDRFGHPFGDRVIAEVATCLSSAAGPESLVARLGGEEFLIAMQDTGSAEAIQAAEGLRRAVDACGVLADFGAAPEVVRVSVSIGCAILTVSDAADVDTGTLISRADDALYAAKDAGRGRVVCMSMADARDRAFRRLPTGTG